MSGFGYVHGPGGFCTAHGIFDGIGCPDCAAAPAGRLDRIADALAALLRRLHVL